MPVNSDIESTVAILKQVVLERNGLRDWQHSHEGTHKNEQKHRTEVIESVVEGKLKVFQIQNEHFNEKLGNICKAIEVLAENIKETNKGFAEYKSYINNKCDEVAQIAQTAVKKASWHNQLKQYAIYIIFALVLIFTPTEKLQATKEILKEATP